MASQAHGEPITGSSLTASPFSTKKKKIQSQKLNPINPSRRWRLASRRVVTGRGEIKPQYKSKSNTELSKPNTEHRGVYQKKKKKKSPIHKPKSNPVNHLPTDGHVVAVVAAASLLSSSSFAWSPLIADRRSENGERRSVFGVRRSVLLPALRQGISLFFLSDSFSVSRSLIFISVFLSVFSFLQINIVDVVIGSSLCLCASASAPMSGARCLLRQSGPPSRTQGLSLPLSQFLSLYLTE